MTLCPSRALWTISTAGPDAQNSSSTRWWSRGSLDPRREDGNLRHPAATVKALEDPMIHYDNTSQRSCTGCGSRCAGHSPAPGLQHAHPAFLSMLSSRPLPSRETDSHALPLQHASAVDLADEWAWLRERCRTLRVLHAPPLWWMRLVFDGSASLITTNCAHTEQYLRVHIVSCQPDHDARSSDWGTGGKWCSLWRASVQVSRNRSHTPVESDT
jgi:hypothetical protein